MYDFFCSTKQSVVAPVAVRLVPVLFEGSLELLQTERADKMLWVELAKHGGDAAARDGLAAPCAGCSPHLVVVVLAVGETVVLEKVAVREGLVALPESDPNTQRSCRNEGLQTNSLNRTERN